MSKPIRIDILLARDKDSGRGDLLQYALSTTFEQLNGETPLVNVFPPKAESQVKNRASKADIIVFLDPYDIGSKEFLTSFEELTVNEPSVEMFYVDSGSGHGRKMYSNAHNLGEDQNPERVAKSMLYIYKNRLPVKVTDQFRTSDFDSSSSEPSTEIRAGTPPD